MKRAKWRLLAVAAFLLAESGVAATAAADVCSDLQARLDSLDRTNAGTSSAYNTFSAQVTQQQQALDQASGTARNAGCYGGIFSPAPNPKCPQMLSSLATMQANLNKLTATRDQYRPNPYTQASQRNDVVRQLQLSRCGSYASVTPPPSPGGLISSLFGAPPYSPFGNGYFTGQPALPGGGNTYRALCVRSCDGYYFPIDFETTPDHFAADAAACSSMCPAASASLYVYPNPGGDVSSMVSLNGSPYSALPTAFKYRTTYNPTCTCGSAAVVTISGQAALPASLAPSLPPGPPLPQPIYIPGANLLFSPIPPALAAAAPAASAALVPLPTLRPAASEDPETLADRAGGFSPAPAGNQAAAPQIAGVTPDGRPIRLVGPNYYVAR